MATASDFLETPSPQPNYIEDRDTLLAKYRIPIQHFEYDYVEKCGDGRELEKILLILRSGEEGYYPDLIKTTEERLRVVKPKSKLLEKVVQVLGKQDLKKEELQEISEDLNNFVLQMSKNDKELESRRHTTTRHEVDIRKFKELEPQPGNDNEKRISSTDYKAWDTYDPDTELLKMELEEERQKKKVLEMKKQPKPKKSVSFNKFSTEAEASFFSDREKEKGNEFFKAGDYEEALQYYTNSVQSKANINNLNNRAVTYLILKKYAEALKDCDKVLALEEGNLKAHLRKAEALENMQRFEEALESVEFVIQRDPNNCNAQVLAERVRKNCCRSLKKTTMKIIEMD
ncbi:hypothetical protein JTB14_002698 [Gonioctena quinquepunctata]|nr:hypothetical protein JTB14_002698 [Gonioctena quinquepunctata]